MRAQEEDGSLAVNLAGWAAGDDDTSNDLAGSSAGATDAALPASDSPEFASTLASSVARPESSALEPEPASTNGPGASPAAPVGASAASTAARSRIGQEIARTRQAHAHCGGQRLELRVVVDVHIQHVHLVEVGVGEELLRALHGAVHRRRAAGRTPGNRNASHRAIRSAATALRSLGPVRRAGCRRRDRPVGHNCLAPDLRCRWQRQLRRRLSGRVLCLALRCALTPRPTGEKGFWFSAHSDTRSRVRVARTVMSKRYSPRIHPLSRLARRETMPAPVGASSPALEDAAA